MKSRITAISVPLVIAGLYLAMHRTVPKSLTVYPPPPVFFWVEWDAPDHPVDGYKVYLGAESNSPYAPIKLDYQINLNGRPELPILIHQPFTYVSIAEYRGTEESPRTPELRYPPQ